jgi:hypothetical protein
VTAIQKKNEQINQLEAEIDNLKAIKILLQTEIDELKKTLADTGDQLDETSRKENYWRVVSMAHMTR